MPISKKRLHRFCLLGGILGWLSLTGLGMTEQYFIENQYDLAAPTYLKGSLLNLFLFSTYMYSRLSLELKGDTEDFYSFIWRAFALSVACCLGSLSLNIVIRVVEHTHFAKHILLLSLFYHVDFGLLVIFLISALVKWKKMILFQSTRPTSRMWEIFEYLLIASLFFHFFRFDVFDTIFNVMLAVLIPFSMGLSFNLKWVAYLEYRQKLMGVFVFAVLLIIQAYFLIEMLEYAQFHLLVIDIMKSEFFVSIYFFTALYCFTSLLVLLFNLPTASAFEKRLNEVTSFRDLSQAVLDGENEKQIYNLLIDSAVQTVKADAAWIEVENAEKSLYYRFLTKMEAQKLRELLTKEVIDHKRIRKLSPKNWSEDAAEMLFSSGLCVPLVSNTVYLGTLILLKKSENAFDNVTISTIGALAAQASISIYNFKLIADAIETERYREEIKIAQKVHDSLLPEKMDTKGKFEIEIRACSASEVGGDYYDYYCFSENKFAFIIADVSGKGTSAAFNMAQMKGIFHSLVRFDLPPDLFCEYANDAISGCLEKNSFITATYLIIDVEARKIYVARAGHCPMLYFSAKDKKARYYQGKGLGLGIIRNKTYSKYTQVEIINYEKGDVIALYTDGISEARKKQTTEEYGFERIKNLVEDKGNQHLKEITDALMQDVYEFAEDEDLNDDYTLIMMKF